MILEVGTHRDANPSFVCLAPATTAAGSNTERIPSKTIMTRRSLLCSLFIIAGIEIDPALGRQVLRADSACNRNQESFRLKREQAACQCGAPRGNFLNCIVFSKLREGRAAWTSRDSQGSGGPVPPGWWLSARQLRRLRLVCRLEKQASAVTFAIPKFPERQGRDPNPAPR